MATTRKQQDAAVAYLRDRLALIERVDPNIEGVFVDNIHLRALADILTTYPLPAPKTRAPIGFPAGYGPKPSWFDGTATEWTNLRLQEMSPQVFAALGVQVLARIPAEGILMVDLLGAYSADERSNLKAVILDLKMMGRVVLTEEGVLFHTV